MEKDEFIKHNPIICNDDIAHSITKEEFLTQAEFFSTHTFILKTLDEDEAKILKLRYGIDNNAPMTYKQMAEVLGLSMEKIKQAEGKVIRKLRHPSRLNLLKKYDDTTFDEGLLQRFTNSRKYPYNLRPL